MNKQIIEVPKEVRFISDWPDFDTDLLRGHCILNKTITGCGFTHYSLVSNIPTILCSPRKFLLENKYRQHGSSIHLVINDGEKSLDVDGINNLNYSGQRKDFSYEDKLENFEIINDIKSSLSLYIFNCKLSNQTPKILVTYDSLKYVLEVIGHDIINYSVIVDEFQNIFMDSSFKAEVELNFIDVLQDCPNVTYLSATPFIEEYLDELDEFKALPYYELKWDSSRLRTIEVDFKKTSMISREVDKFIKNYLSGNFITRVDENKNVYESREIVFYVNSVKMIRSIIKRNRLTPDQVNIICANTKSNQDTLEKIGHCIGTAPLIGEPHKMFTFCTRTTYVGADFYSTNAYTVVVSDCKIDSLTSDIRMDFPQIMGRQRLKENVFRNECTFIFSLADNSITLEQFKEISEKKLKKSNLDLRNYSLVSQDFDQNGQDAASSLIEDLRTRIKVYRYNNDYTGISIKEGKPVVNKLVYLSEKRAFELRSNTYKTVFNVYNEFQSLLEEVSLESSELMNQFILECKDLYEQKTFFVEKMKVLCELFLNERTRGRISPSDILWISREYKNYLNILGPERIRALGYCEVNLKKELANLSGSFKVLEELMRVFTIGNRYLLKDIKDTLKGIYQKLGLTKTAKASDLEEYFEVRIVWLKDPISKKQSKGYEILSLKE